MTDARPTEPDDSTTGGTEPDVIDEEAAHIDPRDPDAEEQIEELIDTAAEMGRDTPAPDEVDVPDPDSLPASD